MTRKKLLLIVGGAALLAIIIAGAYWYFTKGRVKVEVVDMAIIADQQKHLALTEEEKEKNITVEEKAQEIIDKKQSDAVKKILGQQVKKEKEPEVKVVSIIKISDESVMAPTFSADQKKILYFDTKEKEFFQMGLNGENENAITKNNFQNVEKIVWAQSKDKILITSRNSEKNIIENSVFDLASQSTQKIDSKFQNPIISPAGNQIAYIYTESDKNIFNVSIADIDGKNWRKVGLLSNSESALSWVTAGRLVFHYPSKSRTSSSLYVYDVTEGKDSFVYLIDKFGFTTSVSPDGKRIVWTQAEKGTRRPSLYTGELAKSQNGTKISLNGIADKCAWQPDNTMVICGIPDNFSNYYYQPEDWMSGEFVSKDSFYQINTKANEITKIAGSEQFSKEYDVDKPMVSADGKRMYFIRKHDKKLYALVLP